VEVCGCGCGCGCVGVWVWVCVGVWGWGCVSGWVGGRRKESARFRAGGPVRGELKGGGRWKVGRGVGANKVTKVVREGGGAAGGASTGHSRHQPPEHEAADCTRLQQLSPVTVSTRLLTCHWHVPPPALPLQNRRHKFEMVQKRYVFHFVPSNDAQVRRHLRGLQSGWVGKEGAATGIACFGGCVCATG
jgi:hypothetical protein